MDGLLSLLLIAGAFFLMMRFGCGAHAGHGGHGGHETHDRSDAKHVDPVCGVEVGIREGYGKMHDATLYRFCSRDCLDLFEVSPNKYLDLDKTSPRGAA